MMFAQSKFSQSEFEMMSKLTIFYFCFTLITLTTVSSQQEKQPKWEPTPEALEKALEILGLHPIIDGHNDFPLNLRSLLDNDLTEFNFDMDLSSIEPWASIITDHTDLPRLRAGKVGGQFWSCYMGCNTQYQDSVKTFLEQADVIKRLTADNPNDMTFVTTAQGIEDAFAEGKIASMIGIESGHAIGSNLGMLRMFYDIGARYMTLTHSCNTPWADAAQAEDGSLPVRSEGLSTHGETIVKEMNRLGMLVDLAHVSSDTMNDALDVTRAPIIFSHSSAREITDNVRNVPDDVLEQVASNNGIVMVNFYSCYVNDLCIADVLDVAAHVNHIKQVAGPDHVGIGSDFCGVALLPDGLKDSSMYPNLFAALVMDGWSDEDLGKLASGNLIRVFKEVEAVRDGLVSEAQYQSWLPVDDLVEGEETNCNSEYD